MMGAAQDTIREPALKGYRVYVERGDGREGGVEAKLVASTSHAVGGQPRPAARQAGRVGGTAQTAVACGKQHDANTAHRLLKQIPHGKLESKGLSHTSFACMIPVHKTQHLVPRRTPLLSEAAEARKTTTRGRGSLTRLHLIHRPTLSECVCLSVVPVCRFNTVRGGGIEETWKRRLPSMLLFGVGEEDLGSFQYRERLRLGCLS